MPIVIAQQSYVDEVARQLVEMLDATRDELAATRGEVARLKSEVETMKRLSRAPGARRGL